MHARQLAEFAAIIVGQGQRIAIDRLVPIDNHIHRYWVTSRCRIQQWQDNLTEYQYLAEHQRKLASIALERLRPTLEEIFISEILTRIWSAIGTGAELQAHQSEPVLRNLFLDHAEARRRSLKILLRSNPQNPTARVLNCIRRRTERWTDMLLGYVSHYAPTAEFAFDLQRVRDFACSCDTSCQANDTSLSMQLIGRSLSTAFADDVSAEVANPELNRELVSSILPLLDVTAFDSIYLSSSAWLEHVNQRAEDAEMMITDLLAQY